MSGTIGVVGCGSIGSRHLRNLLAIGVEHVLATDPIQTRADAFAKEKRVDWCKNLEELLGKGPRAVLVCTPTHLHMPMALAALEAGAHVFVEKPLASSLMGTEQLIKTAQQLQLRVVVGCNMRFHPGVANIKKAIDEGLVGRPYHFQAYFGHYLPYWRPDQDYRQTYSASQKQGGGIIMEGVHEIDYLQWLAGPIVDVAAHKANVSDLEISTEDVAALFLRFESGAVGEIHLNYLRYHKHRGCEIIGTDGIVSWSSEGKSPEKILVRIFDRDRGDWWDLYEHKDYNANLMYRQEIQSFFDLLNGHETPLLNVADAQRTMEIVSAAKSAPEATTLQKVQTV